MLLLTSLLSYIFFISFSALFISAYIYSPADLSNYRIVQIPYFAFSNYKFPAIDANFATNAASVAPSALATSPPPVAVAIMSYYYNAAFSV